MASVGLLLPFLFLLCRWCASQIGRPTRPKGSVYIQQADQVQHSQQLQATGPGQQQRQQHPQQLSQPGVQQLCLLQLVWEGVEEQTEVGSYVVVTQLVWPHHRGVSVLLVQLQTPHQAGHLLKLCCLEPADCSQFVILSASDDCSLDPCLDRTTLCAKRFNSLLLSTVDLRTIVLVSQH